jgi:methionyl-tRNA synthetase
VIPDAAAKVWAQLGLGDIKKADLKNLAWGGLKPGTKLGAVEPVFPRAEKDAVARMKEIEEKDAPAVAAAEEKVVAADKPVAVHSVAPAEMKKEETRHEAGGRAVPAASDATTVVRAAPRPHTSRLKAALDGLAVAIAESTNETAALLAVETFVKDNIGGGSHAASPKPAPAAAADKISIDDFAKVELRVAQIKVAERVPKADKLLRLEVDLGYEQRQIVAGIAEAYAPESLVGRKIVIVANLTPRKLRGLESNGMLLAASLEGGKPVLAGFLEDVEIGARLK